MLKNWLAAKNCKPMWDFAVPDRASRVRQQCYCFDGREITLLVYAEGKRTFESQYAIDRRSCDDGPYPAPDPTVYYLALARVKHDSAEQLEPGRFVRVKAFECEELGFDDTERLYVKRCPGECFPKALKILT